MENINLFDLYAKITLDDSDYTEGLEDASHKTSNFASKLKSGLATAAKVTTAALAATGTAVIGLGKIALDYNAQMESYTTDFEVMLGDVEAAALKVEELKELGASTPFEMTDLAEATKTLLAFNVSADDSTDVLKSLGDISLGNVQKLESLTRAYGKMNAAQKVTLEDINMMIDAGFNPLLIVAEQTGETMEEVYDRISSGEVAFEEIQNAIETATSEGGQFFQGMEKASQNFEGRMSTLKDNATALLGTIFQPITDGISQNVLPKMIENVDLLAEEFEENGIEGLVSAAGEMIGETVVELAEGAPEFVAVAMDLVFAFVEGILSEESIASIGDSASETVSTLVSKIVEHAPDLLVAAVALLLTLAQSLIENVDDLLIAIPTLVQEIVSAFAENGDVFAQIGKNIVKSIWSGVESLGTWFHDQMNGWLGDAMAGLNAAISGGFYLGPSGAKFDGSHAGGLDYVPFNGYVAQLHRGEMVLTASEAGEYRSNNAILRSINALTGAVLANGSAGGTYEIVLQVGDAELARVLFDPLKSVVQQRGEALA